MREWTVLTKIATDPIWLFHLTTTVMGLTELGGLDDSDASIYPGAQRLQMMALIKIAMGRMMCAVDNDGTFDDAVDCDDSDASIYPGAPGS